MINEKLSTSAILVIAELWHPQDVVREARLSVEGKRRLLATWAFDDRAVLGEPTLRQLPNGAVVSLASILDALKQLDEATSTTARKTTAAGYPRRYNDMLTKWRRKDDVLRRRWYDDDDDDDPPPAPAVYGARLTDHAST